MNGDRDLTQKFARSILNIGRSDLSEDDKEQIRRLVLDCLGVSRVVAGEGWIQPMIQWAERFRGTGSATVVGTNLLVSPHIAALINGTAAHGYELDDTHHASMSHPGAVVIPTALALAAQLNSSQDETLKAIAAGYEAMTRIGMASNAAKVVHHGFHPTALFGVYGAAAAAAVLLHLDEAALLRAWGHALSLSSGSMQFSDETDGTTVKRMHAGYAAHHGIMASEFAALGIEAPARSVDGKYGFLAIFSEDPRPGEMEVAPDARLQIHMTSLKPYSCCRLFHSMIDGLREATDGFKVKPEDITGIHVRGPSVLYNQHMMRRPTSVMAAQYSLPFAVGATLVYGPDRFDAYDEERLGDSQILAVGDRVDVTPDTSFEVLFPAKMGSAVELTFVDGSKREALVMDCKGTEENPLSSDEVYAKAAGLTRNIRPEFDIAAARSMLWGDASGADLAGLLAVNAR